MIYLLYLMKLLFSRQLSKNRDIQNFMDNLPLGDDLLPGTDRRTGGQTDREKC